MLYREKAKALNMHLLSTPSLNTHPQFIRCLKELVLQAQDEEESGIN